MAVKIKDIETLWKQYSEDVVKKGISVAQYFESNGVPYRTFEKWYKKKYSSTGILDCVVSGSPDESLQDPDEGKSGTIENRRDVYVSYVNIGLSNGVRIEHHRLSYGELICFINKLQSLCSA
jgi:hypothetical protein